MSQEVVNAVGRRKSAVARVYLKAGSGQIIINDRPIETYFPLDIFQYVVKQPLLVTKLEGSYDVKINVCGGGIKGQAEASRLGISRCLLLVDAELRAELKKNGFLTRDARIVERKKPGQPGARKRFQFSKR
ncbi:MAG: 30S ribosomal protein S9 [Mucinivorans sp.]